MNQPLDPCDPSLYPPSSLSTSVEELNQHSDWFRDPARAYDPGPFVAVVDDFYPDPDQIRRMALGQEFVQYSPPLAEQVGEELAAKYSSRRPWFATALLRHRGRLVKRPISGFRYAPAELRKRFSELLGEAVAEDTWEELGDWWNGAFHLIYPSSRGSIHHHYKEGDVYPRGWSGVVYLSPNPKPWSGTSIWRSKATGLCLATQGPHFHGESETDQFELALLVENRYNRLVLFRENVLHRAEEGFGTTKADGRLTQTFFFRTERTA